MWPALYLRCVSAFAIAYMLGNPLWGRIVARMGVREYERGRFAVEVGDGIARVRGGISWAPATIKTVRTRKYKPE